MEYKKEHIEQEIWFSAINKNQLAKYDKKAAYEVFKKRVEKEKKIGNRTNIGFRSWSMQIASVVLLLLTVSYFSYRGGLNTIKSQMGNMVVEAPQGSRSEVVLPDGSRVCLNAGSRMTYSKEFGYSSRTIELDGEGYFEVTRNERLAFNVKTNALSVKVLGTKFDVRDYSSDNDATVLLAEGSVALNIPNQAQSKQIVLTPGQSAVYQKESNSLKVMNADVDNGLEWTKGNLIFSGESLDRIVKDLQRNYNVKITVRDTTLYSLHFYGDFVRQEQSLKEVMEALAATGRMKYCVNEHHVIIYK